MDKNSKPLFIISGQTATGKTSRGLSFAKKIDGEILSADSRQSYKYLDVISGKDIEEDNYIRVAQIGGFSIGYYVVQSVRIWLYDITDPKQRFSSYEWALCAREVLSILQKRKKIPLIVGGSYFYIKTLIDGLTSSAEPDWNLRRELEALTVDDLQKKLSEIDPDILRALNSSDRYNKRRLIRKIEQRSEINQRNALPALSGYSPKWIGLIHLTENALKNAIEKRIKERMKRGALDEISLLLNMGYMPGDPGMQSIGYQQLTEHICSDVSLENAIERWKIKERQYAKRQKTAMKKDVRVQFFSPGQINNDELSSMLQ